MSNQRSLVLDLVRGVSNLVLPEFCLSCEQWIRRSTSVPLCHRHSSPLKRIPVPRCYQCQRPLRPDPGERQVTAEALICGNCRTRTLVLQRLRSGFLFEKAAQEIVVDWKFHRRRRWSAWLGRRLRRMVEPTLEKYEIAGLIPVPLHRSRLSERGFNQARDLALELAGPDRPVLDVLTKVRRTEPQSNLSREERQVNLRGAFQLEDEVELEPGSLVVLVDDIYTTGSTLRECARTIASERACRVLGVTLMRTLPSRYT